MEDEPLPEDEPQPPALPPRQAARPHPAPGRAGRPAGPTGRERRGERFAHQRGAAEPRGRRGPIVDPRRRLDSDPSARTARPSRAYPALGTIKELKPNGYGFLEDSAGRRRFFHRSEVVGIRFDQLRTGQKVQFDPSEDVRGLRALQVRPAPTPRPRGGERRGQRLDHEGWAGRPRRAPDEPPRAPWRSSLSPFRGEPPGRPPRRKR
jgi:CspA family cold shock protein